MGENGLINFLCILPFESIEKGIAFIRFKMNEGVLKAVFDTFWNKYFLKTWMKKSHHYQDKTGLYLFTSWNISHLIEEDGRIKETEDGVDVMVNRTNNPLERFNRRLNEAMPTHPTMQHFVETIKNICNDYVDQMRATSKGIGRKMKHATLNMPTIPEDFDSFIF